MSLLALGVHLAVAEPPSPARPGLGGIVGADDRRPLDSTEWPWSAIGRVNVGGSRHCTGTLVGPRHVLTAAHCLPLPRTGKVVPHRIHFLAGYRRGEYLAHSAAERVVCGDGGACAPYRGARGAAAAARLDWALIVLREALPLRPVPIAATRAGGETVIRAGYGRDRAHLLSVHEACRLQDAAAGPGLLHHDCDATHGGSGSPLLRGEGDETELVAIAVAYGRAATGDAVGLAVAAEASIPALKRENVPAPAH